MSESLEKNTAYTQSQKMMIFILAMSLNGLANLFTELLPAFEIGPVDFSISYMAFVPIILVILFHPLYAALGASIGAIIFGDLLLGDFSGLGEVEGFLQITLAMYIAGLLVKDPTSKKQISIAALVGVSIDQLLGAIVDIGKVWYGVEELEAVPGLPESIVVMEAFDFVNNMVISGVLFGLIPALYLIPKLYGKIEPLMGMNPRDENKDGSSIEFISVRLITITIFLGFVGLVAEFIAEMDISFAFWESGFMEQFEDGFIWLPVSVLIIIAVAIIIIAVKFRKKNAERNNKKWSV